SASPPTGRTPAIAVRASRPRVMYSGFAGIVSRTDRPSSFITSLVPGGEPSVTRRNRVSRHRQTWVRILVRLRPLTEAQRQVEPGVAALDREVGDLTRAHVRDNPRNVLGTGHALPVDRHDHVAVPREDDPEVLRARGVGAKAGLHRRATGLQAGHDRSLGDRVPEA